MRGVIGLDRIPRSPVGRLATLGGIVGLVLMFAVELIGGPQAIAPALRYEPSAPAPATGHTASRDIAYGVAPSVDALRTAFTGAGYDLEGVRKGGKPVPRLRLTSLPRDLPQVDDVRVCKSVFLRLALPLVLEANRNIAGQRRRLQQIARKIESGETLSTDSQRWLTRTARLYGVPPDRIDLLLRRADIVPPSLALAQAAAESGWGTSRFALDGNAVFGQWTTTGGKGMVPLERPPGSDYKVRAFDRLIDSFSAYMLNLNTHRAYRDFRHKRENMRDAGKPLDGYALAETLLAYSERGQDYVDMLHTIIRVNRLAPLDRARLGETEIGFVDDV